MINIKGAVINAIHQLIDSAKKIDYMSWNSYASKIDFIDLFNFQQQARLENLKNSPSF